MSPLFIRHADRLVIEHDFGPFAEEAGASLDPRERPGQADALEVLLAETIAALIARNDDRSNAARAINAYVSKVFPLRLAAGLDRGEVKSLAEKHGLMNRLYSETLKALNESDEAWVESAAKLRNKPGVDHNAGKATTANNAVAAGQQPKAPNGTARPPAQGEEKPVTTQTTPEPNGRPRGAQRADNQLFKERALEFEEACKHLVQARKKGRITAIVAGLATSGKTFFIRRLFKELQGEHTAQGLSGALDFSGSTTDRTKGVIYYGLSSTGGMPSIDLYDVPGEQFKELALAHASEPSEEIKTMCAVFGAADICILIEPALEVLAQECYLAEGDSYNKRTADDFRKQLKEDAKFRDLAKPAFEQEVQQRVNAFRLGHIELVKAFANNLDSLRIRIVHLRNLAAKALEEGKPEALKAAVEKNLATAYSEQRTERHRPLPIPGLLLLSKADEYVARAVVPGDEDFDRDPALTLSHVDPDRMRVYSRAFRIFGVDFITSEPAEDPLAEDSDAYDIRTFVGRPGAAGFDRIIQDWIAPSAKAARRKIGPAHNLSSPWMAYFWRRLLDPEFKAAWSGPV